MERKAFEQFVKFEQDHWWFQGRRGLYIPLLAQVLERDGALPSGTADRAMRGQLDQTPPKSDLQVMDVGCGVGSFIGLLKPFGTVRGCELDLDAAAHCHVRGYPNTSVALSNQLPVPTESHDLLTLWDVLEHTPDDRAVLAELHRTLRPGGHVAMSVPAYQFLFANNDRIAHHHRRYTRGDLVAKLREAGFEVRKATYVNVVLGLAIIPAVLAIKLKERLRPRENDETTNLSWALPRRINRVLAKIFAGERHVLRHVSAPFGHSLFVVARKPRGA